MIEAEAAKPVVPAGAERFRRRPGPAVYVETAIRWLCFAAAAVSILTTLGIVFVLVKEAYLFFKQVSPSEFFTGTRWAPLFQPRSFGVLPLIVGTLMITVGAGLIAIPLGTLVGLYLSEYASVKVRAVVKPALEILAGIPTVVYGYFGVFFVTPLLRMFVPNVEVFNAASGAIVVGIMILPLVSSLCEDALSAVPRGLREGAYALGATKFEVGWRTVFPAALSGIMASFVLALSRAVGETMAVTLAAGMSPKLTFNPAESIQTMTAYIVQISRGDTPAGTVEYQTIFAVGVTLFAFTMAMNILAIRLVKRFRQVYS
ncbi:MAG: phosphate ABC transporter permease subunit PstC [Fimbriimonadales bacterium]|nr:phosphate ABC transporter permease subunit PstC [Fimbriimonadales bacterium]